MTSSSSTTTTPDQYTMQDPTTMHPRPPFPKQPQPQPGLAKLMDPKPDHGEESYRGTGRLHGRKALITGADSGIGRAAAIAFAREGADVVLNYLESEEADAREVVELIEAEGRTAVAVPGDLRDEAFCTQLVERAAKELDGLDILVNVAGEQQDVASISDLTTEQFDSTMKANIYAMFWLCKAAVEHLPAGATIINTASVQSYQPSDSLLDYATTKAAIVAFTKSLSQQLAPKGIRVNAVAPGPVWTPLQPSGGQTQEALTEFGGDTPLGRPGQPAECAPLYVFLASPESSFVVGETYGVTGGRFLP
ncbi:MAG: NAD(P)-dependent oxidoreductase [Thermoleophilia bacterium]|nr:NAD(P)-dependent oxidoreductase [Thermoleophilia bacterium]